MSAPSVDLLDVTHKVEDVMQCQAHFMRNIASNMKLFFPGSVLIPELYQGARDLEAAVAELRQAIGKEVSRCVTDADRNSRAMLQASLVGLAIGSGKPLPEFAVNLTQNTND